MKRFKNKSNSSSRKRFQPSIHLKVQNINPWGTNYYPLKSLSNPAINFWESNEIKCRLEGWERQSVLKLVDIMCLNSSFNV